MYVFFFVAGGVRSSTAFDMGSGLLASNHQSWEKSQTLSTISSFGTQLRSIVLILPQRLFVEAQIIAIVPDTKGSFSSLQRESE